MKEEEKEYSIENNPRHSALDEVLRDENWHIAPLTARTELAELRAALDEANSLLECAECHEITVMNHTTTCSKAAQEEP